MEEFLRSPLNIFWIKKLCQSCVIFVPICAKPTYSVPKKQSQLFVQCITKESEVWLARISSSCQAAITTKFKEQSFPGINSSSYSLLNHSHTICRRANRWPLTNFQAFIFLFCSVNKVWRQKQIIGNRQLHKKNKKPSTPILIESLYPSIYI